MNKKLITAASIALAACVAIGGTIAYLWDDTETLENTFTVGSIKIDLAENVEPNFHVTPGVNEEKDPTVTVESVDGPSYLFVEVTDTLNENLTWKTAAGWTPLPGNENVLYRTITADDKDATYPIIADNTVYVSNELTGEVSNLGTLSFKAYAIQQSEDFEDVTAAWDAVHAAADKA